MGEGGHWEATLQVKLNLSKKKMLGARDFFGDPGGSATKKAR